MKLLFDENLSPKLVAALIDVFPGSAHIDRIGLGGESIMPSGNRQSTTATHW
ncbi:DUF5615 family PIN-like protein [Methylotuvimicrobium sp. KM2]|jgi:predicted nuclease of predicted toxin-antitoxin system|uniref:DUF5615 family PIN-like protein n=1 Tax=Methylotuvimicrobium sp. KM2 TaxID=3133976 RepID=UPI00310182BA